MPSNLHQQGSLVQADFLDNIGGINLTDTPFKVSDNQCLESYNFDYISTGGIRKRQGIVKKNASAYAVLQTLGLYMYVDPNNSKTIMRATDSKMQSLDSSTYLSTDLVDDTAVADNTPFTSGSSIPVVFNQFNSAAADRLTGTGNTLWMAGGGLSTITGAYSTTKYTTNGATVPTGSISTSDAGGSGSLLGTGTYWWAASLYKGSTQVISNLALDSSASITAGHNASVDITALVNPDSTKYSQVWLYRSSIGGSTGFTVGDLVVKVNIIAGVYSIASGGGSITSLGVYTDTGTAIVTSLSVPRSFSTLMDNSMLPTGTYKTITTFKRRLVTATGSTIYLSDLNKPESWPQTNVITIPSGGNITGLAVIYYATTNSAQATDEFLVIFKEREVWALTGDSFAGSTSDPGSGWVLKFVDSIGCPSQSLITQMNGAIAWLDYRGVYIWTGAGKPIYCSRPIETLFQDDGDLDKSQIMIGRAAYYRKYNEVIWFLSSKSKGINHFMLKLDLRLTLPQITDGLNTSMLEGVFTFDYISAGVTGQITSAFSGVLPGLNDEYLIVGDSTGYTYGMYSGFADVASGPQFSYKTKFLDFGSPGVTKRFHKVIVYLNNIGNYNLTLNYWSDYRTATSNLSQKQQLISTANGTSDTALWDVAVWDVAYWDNYTPSTTTVTFNLSSENNNCEGDALQLQFQQGSINAPVTIYGFSVIYSILGTRK